MIDRRGLLRAGCVGRHAALLAAAAGTRRSTRARVGSLWPPRCKCCALAVLTVLLALAARHGALPLLLVALGVLVARPVVMHAMAAAT